MLISSVLVESFEELSMRLEAKGYPKQDIHEASRQVMAEIDSISSQFRAWWTKFTDSDRAKIDVGHQSFAPYRLILELIQLPDAITPPYRIESDAGRRSIKNEFWKEAVFVLRTDRELMLMVA